MHVGYIPVCLLLTIYHRYCWKWTLTSDFYLWGNLKAKTYRNNPLTTGELKNEIKLAKEPITILEDLISHRLLCVGLFPATSLTMMMIIGPKLNLGAKGVWDFRVSDLVKTLMELIFNPCGEFRWNPECSVSQIHSPHLHNGAPGIFSDLWSSVEMLKREWGAESNGKPPHLFNTLWNFSLGSWVCGGRPAYSRTAA